MTSRYVSVVVFFLANFFFGQSCGDPDVVNQPDTRVDNANKEEKSDEPSSQNFPPPPTDEPAIVNDVILPGTPVPGYPFLPRLGGGGGRHRRPAPQPYSVGGSVNGLNSGSVVVQNKNSDVLTITTGSSSFVFAEELADKSVYEVTILSQPVGLTCSIANGSGTIHGHDVDDLVITCSRDAFLVGGTIIGLTSSGLEIENSDGDNLVVAAGATSFNFATPVASNSAYLVSIATQPIGQVCTVNNGSGIIGNANVANVQIICADNSYTVGGGVSGLA